MSKKASAIFVCKNTYIACQGHLVANCIGSNNCQVFPYLTDLEVMVIFKLISILMLSEALKKHYKENP